MPGQEPFNQVDEISKRHDICYRDYPNDKHGCDKIMLKDLTDIKSITKREVFDKKLVQSIIGTKTKLGLGIDKKITWSDELADELHKPIRHRFPKRRVMVKGIDDTWAIDLIDMSKYAQHNNGIKFLLSVIDIFSKYGWMEPLKNKTAKSVVKVFERILKKRKPKKL